MASTSSSFPVEELSCPVCHDIFQDPVLLSCSHTFCEPCLQRWWRLKGIRQCPVCKDLQSIGNLPRNLAVRNLCQAVVRERESASKRKRAPSGSDGLCGPHGERLKLFCVPCQRAVCVVCRDSEKHTDHRCRPVDEAAKDRKDEVEELLKPLREKLESFQRSDRTANHFKFQARVTERQIKVQFRKLHQFLEDEEANSLAALRVEEQQKSLMVKDKMEALKKDISTITRTIRATEEQLRAEPVSFLLNYKTTMLRVQLTQLPDPPPVSGPLIDVTRHLGNLAFRLWNKMKDIVSYNPVILDPNTAHPVLFVSHDLTSVSPGEEGQQLPVNPERFDHYGYVLGSEGFASGTNAWDVEVGDNEDWEVGVLADSYRRKGRDDAGQLWGMGFYQGKYTAVSKPPPHSGGAGGAAVSPVTDLATPTHRPRRIRVQLDWDEGRLSFSDSDTGALVHAFTQHAFTHTLFPYFNTGHVVPLRILPVPGRLSVKVLKNQRMSDAIFSCI